MTGPTRSMAVAGLLFTVLLASSTRAQAQGLRRGYRPARPVAACPPAVDGHERLLGNFYETPYMTVGGNSFTGEAGFTALQQYGAATMTMYGPFSALRSTTAPVLLYQRSAGGEVRPELGTSFSYPFLPDVSPVKYPVRTQIRGNARSLIRYSPADAGFNWIDQG